MDPKAFSSPVVFIANAIGDHIVALPTVRLLQALFPNLKIVLLPEADTLFFGGINFGKKIFISIQDNNRWRIGNADNELLEQINYVGLREEVEFCDLFFSLNTWHSSSVNDLIELLQPKVSVGFFPQFSIQCPSQGKHIFDLHFQQGQLFAPIARIEDYVAPPFLDNRESILVQSLKDAVYKSKKKILVVHTDTKRKKSWDADLFQEVIDTFLNLHQDYIVCIVGRAHDIKINATKNRGRVIDFCGLPLNLSFGIVGCADLFLGIDSCMLHVADLYNVPSVSLFGPTDATRWGTRFAKHEHIQKPLNEITTREVLNKLSLLVQRKLSFLIF